jgi:hypothetical protein
MMKIINDSNVAHHSMDILKISLDGLKIVASIWLFSKDEWKSYKTPFVRVQCK